MAFLRSSHTPFMCAHLNYPKREATIFDIQISSTSTSHNSIESGTHLFAFQATSDTGRLAVLPLGTKGRISFNDLSHVFISNNPISDFKFLKYPADKDVLVASTRTGNIKLYVLKDVNNGPKSINSPDYQFNTSLGSVETLASHKSVSNFFAVGGDRGWAAFDAETNGQEVIGGTVEGPVKAIDWNTDGNQIAFLKNMDKHRIGTVIDARSKNVVLEYEAHNLFGRECRIINSGKYIISSGFNQARFQEIVIYDTSAGKTFIRQQYDKSISFLIPAFDEDTKLLFLGAKGSTLIRHIDITNMDVATPTQLTCPSQTFGFCLSPKLKCDVMSAEVQKIYQLHASGIAPISCNVMRRSYLEFHEELFPDTAGLESGGTVDDWKKRCDKDVKKVNLRPANAPTVGYIGVTSNKNVESSKNLDEIATNNKFCPSDSRKIDNTILSAKDDEKSNSNDHVDTKLPVLQNDLQNAKVASIKQEVKPQPHNTSNIPNRFYESRSPYYNIKASMDKSKTITDVRDVNSRISSDGLFFASAAKYAAVALNKIEGTVAIYDLEVPGRTPDGTIDAIYNKAPIMDMQFDPFCNTKILCALSNGFIKVWDIAEAEYCTNKVPEKAQPEPGMRNVIIEDETKHSTLSKLKPLAEIKCQVTKILTARYNPVVENVIAAASSNGKIIVINLETRNTLFEAYYHKAAIVTLSWSTDGSRLITIDRDNMFILSDIRKEKDGLIAQKEIKSKSPRAIFTGHIGNELIFVNYLHGAVQKWMLLNLSLDPIKEGDLGPSHGSQSLRPIYDYDTGIIMMYTKSSPFIFMLQVMFDGSIQNILQTTLTNQHQALALLPKNNVDCEAIEIFRIIRLTNNTIEIIPFVVPRREKNLFIRELYPNALVTWKPSMKLDEWLAFKILSPKYCDLKPENVTELPFTSITKTLATHEKLCGTDKVVINKNTVENSENACSIASSIRTFENKTTEAFNVQGWSDAVPVDKDSKLPQDEFQGVEEDEWEEINVEEDN